MTEPAHAALDYLGTKAVWFINLSQSSDRLQQFITHVSPLFYSSNRVDAIDGQKTVSDAEARAFVDRWWGIYEAYRGTMGIANKPPGKAFKVATAKANLAIAQSHLKAISTALKESSDQRLFVAEDDILPRSSLLEGELFSAPDDADVAIWSGGLPMAAVGADSTAFKNGKRFRWRRVQPKHAFNTLGAGLYEMSRPAAQFIHQQVSEHLISFDHAWGFALRELSVYRLDPQSFAQWGQSIRNTQNRKPELRR